MIREVIGVVIVASLFMHPIPTPTFPFTTTRISSAPCTPLLLSSITTPNAELLRIVQAEAGYAGGYESYLAVATVIFNRGSDIHAVVSAKNQFSTYLWKCEVKISDECYRACLDATLGKRNLPENVVYFRTYKSYDDMSGKNKYTVHLRKWGHVFFYEN